MKKYPLQKIDDSLLQEHSSLTLTDSCYFFGEYAGKQGYTHSDMNQLIFNFKKPMSEKGKPGWHYKEKDIANVAQMLLKTKGWVRLKSYTWVPIPPSKIRSDPGFDDRLNRVLETLKQSEPELDIRELLTANLSREAAHAPDSKRLSVTDHLDNLILDDLLKEPKPSAIAVFDDVITTGASFKAAQIILQKNFPDVPIIGIFVARSIWVDEDI